MRIGSVADQNICCLHHLLRDIGVQVECRNNGHRRTNDIADRAEHFSIGIMRMSGDSAPMLADIDPIHRADRLKVVV